MSRFILNHLSLTRGEKSYYNKRMSARYFIQLAYNGAAFSGWQRQPHSPSVQETIEAKLSLVLRHPITLTGCGRTDTGVHADEYYAHFDYAGQFPTGLLNRLNRLLPTGIVLQTLWQTPSEAHARFDATDRAYRYEISFLKDPFQPETVTVFPFHDRVDKKLLQATADLIKSYDAFFPFCKTNSDAKTMNCKLTRAEWVFHSEGWTFHINANRFLRGMVRLIVGCCLEVGQGKMPLSAVKTALDKQQALPRSWSAPAAGLFLTQITYPNQDTWRIIENQKRAV